MAIKVLLLLVAVLLFFEERWRTRCTVCGSMKRKTVVKNHSITVVGHLVFTKGDEVTSCTECGHELYTVSYEICPSLLYSTMPGF